MLSLPPAHLLDQGVIFTCATAEEYDGCCVHGLVITARCDITNNKAQVYSYIPVVSFDDWLWRDGAHILADRTKKSTVDGMAKALVNCGFTASVLSMMHPKDILEKLFPENSTDKNLKAGRKVFERLAGRFEVAEAFLTSGQRGAAKDLFVNEESSAKQLAKELCQNAIAEAYYLPGLYPDHKALGYVALLREIGHIPRVLAASLVDGLEQEAYENLCKAHPRCIGHLCYVQESFAYPIGMVQSPFVEHLMQRLTLLFSRIGVTDVSENLVKTMQTHITDIKEA